MKMRDTKKTALVIIAALCVFTAMKPRAQEPPIKTPSLNIIYTSSLLGRIGPGKSCSGVDTGGLARRFRQLKLLDARPSTRLLLDTGNLADSRSPDAAFRFEIILKTMDRMGYRVMALGPDDLALGLDFIQDMLGKTSIRAVASNLVVRTTGRSPAEPVVYLNVQGIRVAVMAIVSPADFPAPPASSIDNSYLVLDPLETLRKTVRDARKQADLIIVLSQLSYNDTHALHRGVSGVDYMIVGVDGIPGVHNEGGVLLVQKGGESFNMLELGMNPPESPALKQVRRFRLGSRNDSDGFLIRHFPAVEACNATQACGDPHPIPPPPSEPRLSVDQYVHLICNSR